MPVYDFAVYSSDDGSLTLYHRRRILLPLKGMVFEGKRVTACYRIGIVDADGEPILFGDILYGEDGRAWTVLGPSSKRWIFVSGMNVDGEPVKQLVMTKWLTRTPCKAEEK